jgi:predicted Zn-dependent peptidase
VQPAPFTILQSVGTVPGSMANGTTNFDRTNYFEVVPSNELATALWIESDRMAFLLDTLDAKKLAIQRDVVSNERRQSYENRPYGVGRLKVCDVLYPAPHPYYECVIGAIPQIQAASLSDLKAFFRSWYGPQNASLAIVGDFDPAKAKALIERYFGDVVSGPMPARPSVEQPMLSSVVKETVQDKVAQVPRFSLVWNGVKPFSKDEAAADVLAFVLGGSKSSRLYRALVVDKQVATGVSVDDEALGLGGWIEAAAIVRNGHDVSEILPVMQAEIDRMKVDGPTPAEVQRAVRNILADHIRQLETLGGFGGKADVLNMYQTYVGDPSYLGRDLQRYREVTPEAVKAIAQKLLPNGKRLELSIVPVPKTAGAK